MAPGPAQLQGFNTPGGGMRPSGGFGGQARKTMVRPVPHSVHLIIALTSPEACTRSRLSILHPHVPIVPI